ncbi:cupin domain-containing protein [Arcanobacterium haemolyticum]|nr:cupin domain-containing protein [Arcanobacterium haemolyticum]
MADYAKTTIGDEPRTELHDVLGLTGAQVSFNVMPGGASVPFVHAHTNNEEIYLVLSGAGRIELDGEDVELAAGDALRVAPPVKRQIFAGDNGLKYACVQVKAGSLGGHSGDDAVIG